WRTERSVMARNSSGRDQVPAAPPPLFGRMGMGPPAAGKIERAKDRRGTIEQVWGYLRRQRLALALTAVMVVFSTGLILLGPYLLGRAIDQYILRGDLPGLAQNCLLMLAVYAATSLLTWLQSYVMAG